MAFNRHLSFSENIKFGLHISEKSLPQMARELKTTEDTIKTIISARFKRNGKTPPLHKKVFDYLLTNCNGFKDHCQANDINIAS